MRLLNAHTLRLESFTEDPPPYAILSHTWGEEELTYQAMLSDRAACEEKKGFQKVSYACRQAVIDGLSYCWIDSCCIDKTSSAELSESINSMFNWYARAKFCYAYIVDVPEQLESIELENQTDWEDLASSRWWTRGWTLQELIAPPVVTFYGPAWDKLGTRDGRLLELISGVTGIDLEILRSGDQGNFSRLARLDYVPVARRLSWAAHRKTTRKEDEAYCLLGLFRINMPLLYGESGRAFNRLQQEILKTTTDHTIFAWNLSRAELRADNINAYNLLAPGPSCFAHSGDVLVYPYAAMTAFEITSAGLRATLPTVMPAGAGHESNSRLAILNCYRADDPGSMLAVLLQQSMKRSSENIAEYWVPPLTEKVRLQSVPEGEAAAARREPILIRDHTGYAMRVSTPYFWVRYATNRFVFTHSMLRSRSGVSRIQAQNISSLLRFDYPHKEDALGLYCDDKVTGRTIAIIFERQNYRKISVSMQIFSPQEPQPYSVGFPVNEEHRQSAKLHRFYKYESERAGKEVASADLDSESRIRLITSRESKLGRVLDVWTLTLDGGVEGSIHGISTRATTFDTITTMSDEETTGGATREEPAP